MSTPQPISVAAALAVLLAAATSVQAAPVLYVGTDTAAGGSLSTTSPARTAYDRFVAATTGLVIEGFESLTLGVRTTPVEIFGGTGTLTPSVFPGSTTIPGVRIRNTASASGPGRFNVFPFDCTPGACNYFDTITSFSVNLGAAVAAFGFFDTDLGDRGASLTMDFFNGTTAVLAGLVVPNSGERGVGFYGVVDNSATFNRVVFNISQTNPPVDADFIGFDGFVRASLAPIAPPVPPAPPAGVPEPATLALVGASLALMGAARRRSAT